tara:strand:+ start:753 stop:896 length:144 start_codon:yes stop_codon:yes gene_type:complete
VQSQAKPEHSPVLPHHLPPSHRVTPVMPQSTPSVVSGHVQMSSLGAL